LLGAWSLCSVVDRLTQQNPPCTRRINPSHAPTSSEEDAVRSRTHIPSPRRHVVGLPVRSMNTLVYLHACSPLLQYLSFFCSRPPRWRTISRFSGRPRPTRMSPTLTTSQKARLSLRLTRSTRTTTNNRAPMASAS
jgi:hypothetical protein